MPLKSNRKAFSRELDREISKRMNQSGQLIVGQAKRRTPVDTGRLRSSLEFVVEGNVLTVGTRVNYSRFVEQGTRFMAAQPFLVPGLNASRSGLARIWKGD